MFLVLHPTTMVSLPDIVAKTLVSTSSLASLTSTGIAAASTFEMTLTQRFCRGYMLSA